MALIICPGCAYQISDELSECPNCGSPVQKGTNDSNIQMRNRNVQHPQSHGQWQPNTQNFQNSHGQGYQQGPRIQQIVPIQPPVKKKRFGLLSVIAAALVVFGLMAFFAARRGFAERDKKAEENTAKLEESTIQTNAKTVIEASDNNDAKQEEYEYFKDNVLMCKDFTIKITDYKIIKKGEAGNEYGDGPVIAFWYDITNISGKDINATSAWIGIISAYQDNNPNIENELNVSSLPDERFIDTQVARIKKGGTISNAVAYELSDTFTPVILRAGRFFYDDPLGEITFEIKQFF